MGSRVLSVRIWSYKYGKSEGKNETCAIEWEMKVEIKSHGFQCLPNLWNIA